MRLATFGRRGNKCCATCICTLMCSVYPVFAPAGQAEDDLATKKPTPTPLLNELRKKQAPKIKKEFLNPCTLQGSTKPMPEQEDKRSTDRAQNSPDPAAQDSVRRELFNDHGSATNFDTQPDPPDTPTSEEVKSWTDRQLDSWLGSPATSENQWDSQWRDWNGWSNYGSWNWGYSSWSWHRHEWDNALPNTQSNEEKDPAAKTLAVAVAAALQRANTVDQESSMQSLASTIGNSQQPSTGNQEQQPNGGAKEMQPNSGNQAEPSKNGANQGTSSEDKSARKKRLHARFMRFSRSLQSPLVAIAIFFSTSKLNRLQGKKTPDEIRRLASLAEPGHLS